MLAGEEQGKLWEGELGKILGLNLLQPGRWKMSQDDSDSFKLGDLESQAGKPPKAGDQKQSPVRGEYENQD